MAEKMMMLLDLSAVKLILMASCGLMLLWGRLFSYLPATEKEPPAGERGGEVLPAPLAAAIAAAAHCCRNLPAASANRSAKGGKKGYLARRPAGSRWLAAARRELLAERARLEFLRGGRIGEI
ncbi:MAG: hypothetical protein GX890_07355 [Firmicutes bacterium]|jgi:hypothetical protein|nr:hypothetical protein [Bacillota bacterium]HPU01163.1 hypothetical protein [Bacillota bacterium]